MTVDDFLKYYILNAPQLSWFLGAGSSRSAGMPSASDIIWDLKRRYYCIKENQSITDNELSNEVIRDKIQSFLGSLKCPPLGSENEYSYYFKLVLGDRPELHQKYLEEKLSKDLISINSGYRIIAALIAMKKIKIIFTTNFDDVIETAYAQMTGKSLQGYSLNGSYAALNALNNENFPIYAKMHGDFRFFEMKNLPEQLQVNDVEIEKCFINSCSRYGIVVAGYSGRDKNVMAAFDKALENENAFPKGLFWITSIQGNIFPSVSELIAKAKTKGINAHIIDAGTFDALLNSIWKNIDNRPDEFDRKVRRAIFEIPKIRSFTLNGKYPLIRTNAFPTIELPKTCLSIETVTSLTMTDFKEKVVHGKSSAIITKETSILAWGPLDEIYKVIPVSIISTSKTVNIEHKLNAFKQNSLINAFYNRALSVALVKGKPLKLRRRHEYFYAVISSKSEGFDSISSILKKGLAIYNFKTQTSEEPPKLAGLVPGTRDTFWMESVQISIECVDNKFYLMLLPDIWIEPVEKRRDARDFLTEMKKFRYNQVQNNLLNAWKEILLGNDKQVTVKLFNDEVVNNAIFILSTTTAFSFRQTNE